MRYWNSAEPWGLEIDLEVTGTQEQHRILRLNQKAKFKSVGRNLSAAFYGYQYQ